MADYHVDLANEPPVGPACSDEYGQDAHSPSGSATARIDRQSSLPIGTDLGLTVPETICVEMQEATRTTAPLFGKFTSLPVDIQYIVWDICLPVRIFTLWSSTKQRPGRLPMISHVCHDARRYVATQYALKSQLKSCQRPRHTNAQFHTSVPAEQSEDIEQEPLPLITAWYGKKTDLVYLGRDECDNALVNLPQVHDSSDTAENHIMRLAQDSEAPLMLATNLAYWLQGIADVQRVANILYQLIRTREHIHLELYHFDLHPTGEERVSAIQTGLFGAFGEAPAVVEVGNIAALRQCQGLLPSPRVACREQWRCSRCAPDSISSRWELQCLIAEGFDAENSFGRATTFNSVKWFFEVLLYHVCRSRGYDSNSINDLVDFDGHLHPAHWLVKKLQLVLPRFTPVVVFQLLPEQMVAERASWAPCGR